MSPRTLSHVHVDINRRPCGCRPDCNFYRYTVENSVGNLNKHVYYTGLQYTNHPRYFTIINSLFKSPVNPS